jgi:cell fate (sporulation/competence/biofilm development) regulator YlbF (YheA/YmcA/DUF963 family)
LTIQELSQLKHLKKEIAQLETLISELEGRPSQPLGCVQGSMINPPYILHTITIEGEPDESVRREIGELKATLQEQRRKYIAEEKRLMDWIEKIPDSITRQIFRYKYVMGLDWDQIAYVVNTTESCAKVSHHRYLKKCNACNAEVC